jgi:hypothetical protein
MIGSDYIYEAFDDKDMLKLEELNKLYDEQEYEEFTFIEKTKIEIKEIILSR